MRRTASVIAAVTAMAIAVVPATTSAVPRQRAPKGSDVRLDEKVRASTIDIPPGAKRAIASLRSERRGMTPAVGTVLPLLGYYDVHGKLLVKDFTLRGAGDHAEDRVQQHRRQIEAFAFGAPMIRDRAQNLQQRPRHPTTSDSGCRV